MKTNKKSGYTLIELMVVIVIIGILATLGLVTYQNALRRTRDAKRVGDLKDIAAAQEQLKAISGDYAFAVPNTNCPSTVGSLTFPTTPANTVNYSCNGNDDVFCVLTDLERDGGNCSACNADGTFTTSASNPNYCVVSKQ